MMTSDDKVGGWVKKGQNHDDVILECPLTKHEFWGLLITKSQHLMLPNLTWNETSLKISGHSIKKSGDRVSKK